MEVGHQLWLLALIANSAFSAEISRGGIRDELIRRVVPANYKTSGIQHFREKRSIVDWDRRANSDLSKVNYDVVISQLPTSYRVQAPPVLSSKKKQLLGRLRPTPNNRLRPSAWHQVSHFQTREKRSLESQSAESTLEIELQHAKTRRRRQRHMTKKMKSGIPFLVSAEAVMEENKNVTTSKPFQPDIHVVQEQTTIHMKADNNEGMNITTDSNTNSTNSVSPKKWENILSSLGLSSNVTFNNSVAATLPAASLPITATVRTAPTATSKQTQPSANNKTSEISITSRETTLTKTGLDGDEPSLASPKPVLDHFNMMCGALAGKAGNPELSNPIAIEVVKGPVATRAVAEEDANKIFQQRRIKKRIRQSDANLLEPENMKIEAFF